MKQSSPEYDLLDCGGYAVFQGGIGASAVNNQKSTGATVTVLMIWMSGISRMILSVQPIPDF